MENDLEERIRRALKANREALEAKTKAIRTAFENRRRRIVRVPHPDESGVFSVGIWTDDAKVGDS